MTSYQAAVLQDIENIAEKHGLYVMIQYQFSNVGTAYIGSTTDIRVEVSFDFQSRSPNKFLINGAKHGPAGRDNYYIWPTETDRYKEFLARIEELLS